MKTAYQYNAAGLYQGETAADESPLEPGVYLLPARCTFAPPPAEIPGGQWPRWNGYAWDLVTRRDRPTEQQVAAEKLAAFLQANPDVAALIGQ